MMTTTQMPRRQLAAAAASSSSANKDTPLQKEFKRRMLSTLCNIPLEQLNDDAEPTSMMSFGSGGGGNNSSNTGLNGDNVLKSRTVPVAHHPFDHDLLRTMKLGGQSASLSCEADPSRSLAKKAVRKVNCCPTRILDAPEIVDDYYLNLISWSKANILAVALAQSVYLYNATTGVIEHLVTLPNDSDYITSVQWCPVPGQTHYIAVGTNSACVHIFDSEVLRKVRTMRGHTGRVSSLAWNQNILSSAGRDSVIINHDVRVPQH